MFLVCFDVFWYGLSMFLMCLWCVLACFGVLLVCFWYAVGVCLMCFGVFLARVGVFFVRFWCVCVLGVFWYGFWSGLVCFWYVVCVFLVCFDLVRVGTFLVCVLFDLMCF